MKDQYFGDINDYRKYGLLRALQSRGDGQLLIAWMLTPDDGGRDGGFRSYLEDPNAWAKYDRHLYAGLVGILRQASKPSVSLLEGSGLLQRASFHSVEVPDLHSERDNWFRNLLRVASGVDLVFVDPDNGIEVPSKPVGRKGSSKYVTWQELRALWKAGCSLLIYQHFRREPREAFARRLASELREQTGASHTEAFRTPHALFLLALQDRHLEIYGATARLLEGRWRGQIEAFGLADKPLRPTVFGDAERP